MSKTAWYDPLKITASGLPNHRMRLSTASLSIGKNGPIVSFKYMGHKCKGSLAIYEGLFGTLSKDCIIGETLKVVWVIRFGEIDLVVFLVY